MVTLATEIDGSMCTAIASKIKFKNTLLNNRAYQYYLVISKAFTELIMHLLMFMLVLMILISLTKIDDVFRKPYKFDVGILKTAS